MPQALPFITAGAAVYGATRGGDTQVTQQRLDPQTQARYDDLYRRAVGVSNLPFVPYTGARVAGFNPDQLAGFDQIRSNFNQSMGFNPRGQLANMASGGLDTQPFQNLYTEQVIDNAMADLDRGRQLQIQSDQDAAIGRNAFGGSRSAVLEAETNRNFADRAGNLAANLRRDSFNNSIANAFRNRDFQRSINQGLLSDQYRNLGLLSGIGSQHQGLQQGAIDAGYNEFLRGLNYPAQQLGLLQGSVFGMTPGQSTSSSTDQGLFGKLQTGINAYNAANDFAKLFI